MIKVSIEHLGVPTLSGDSMRVLQLLGSNNLNFADLANALEQDPKMATAMLRYANSPMYRRGKTIGNVREALNLLGVTNVRLAVLSNSLRSFTLNCGVEACVYLNHYCMSVATLSRQLAIRCCDGQEENVEITAMMSGMESMVLASNFSNEYSVLFNEAKSTKVSLKELEETHFILGQEKFAAWLARHMRLTPLMAQVLVTLKQRSRIVRLNSTVDYYCGVIRLAQVLVQEDPLEGYEMTVHQVPESRAQLQELFVLSDEDIDNIKAGCHQIISAIHN